MTPEHSLEELKWVGVDFDGVLAEGIWPDRGIGEPIERNIQKMGYLARVGFEPVIHTSRPWSDYKRLEKWLQQNDIPYHAIMCGKLLCRAYIDDRAINSEEPMWINKIPEY